VEGQKITDQKEKDRRKRFILPNKKKEAMSDELKDT
jgi:hypothetical protein